MSNTVRDRPIRQLNLEPMPSEPGEPRRLLVPLKASGSHAPLFVVPGQFGEAFQFTRLVGRLRDDIPFYSFEAKGLWGGVEPHETIQEAAADCIAEMRTVQPQGPYFLGGFSLGGATAWEMTHQLNESGETAHLLLFDMGPETWLTPEGIEQQPRPTFWMRVTHPGRVAIFHARNAFGLTGARRKAYVRSVFRQEVGRIGSLIGLGEDNFLVRFSLKAGRTPPPGHMAVRSGLEEMRERWDWEPCSRRFTLLRAQIQNPGGRRSETLGFTPEIARGGLEVRHVPGHHGFIFSEPHVFTVIAELEGWIDRIEADEGSTAGAPPEMADPPRSLS